MKNSARKISRHIYLLSGYSIFVLVLYTEKRDLLTFSRDITSVCNSLTSVSYFDQFRFEGSENKTITCSTKVCSFGTQVVEKVEVIA